MNETMNLGSTPCGESCAQVGSDTYYEDARAECKRYKEMLIKVFGNPPTGVRLKIGSNPHDYGDYYEVCVVYDDSIEAAVEYAFFLESHMPESWEDGESWTGEKPWEKKSETN